MNFSMTISKKKKKKKNGYNAKLFYIDTFYIEFHYAHQN